jgi:hypothetical protein
VSNLKRLKKIHREQKNSIREVQSEAEYKVWEPRELSFPGIKCRVCGDSEKDKGQTGLPGLETNRS